MSGGLHSKGRGNLGGGALQQSVAYLCGLQALNMLIGVIAVRYFIGQQTEMAPAGPQPLVVRVSSRGHGADFGERPWSARHGTGTWAPKKEIASAAPLELKGLLLYVLQPVRALINHTGLLLARSCRSRLRTIAEDFATLSQDLAPGLREGLGEVVARYPERFVPESGEGAGTAIPVTFHKLEEGPSALCFS